MECSDAQRAMLNEKDRARISAAITEAESRTSGEIFCVLAKDVSRYREVPLVWAAIAAFALPPLFVMAGLQRLALATIFTSWTDESARAMGGLILRALTTFELIQGGIFLCVAVIVAVPQVRRMMTPGFLKSYRVRQAARRHFVAVGARLSHAEPHVLIFASRADRRVELVAHDNIHQAVGDKPWHESVAAVVDGMKSGRAADGFVKAIEICGAAMAQHFPPEGAPKNRLPNTLLET
jgi:putative membrane protein